MRKGELKLTPSLHVCTAMETTGPFTGMEAPREQWPGAFGTCGYWYMVGQKLALHPLDAAISPSPHTHGAGRAPDQ